MLRISLSYYYLLSFYSKSYFVTADFDSVLYYNRLVKRFCNEVELSAEVHDLLSTVYNMEGNVLMQRTQPDSAIISYKKAYEERLQGQQTDYLPDLCINLADANVHKGDYAYAAYYYRRALFICDSLGLPDRNKFRFTMVSDRLIWNYVILSFPIIIMNLQETFFLR